MIKSLTLCAVLLWLAAPVRAQDATPPEAEPAPQSTTDSAAVASADEDDIPEAPPLDDIPEAAPLEAAVEQDPEYEVEQGLSERDPAVTIAEADETIRNASAVSMGYSLGVGGRGSVWGLHLNLPIVELGSNVGSDLTLKIISRWNHGRFGVGYYDPVWYNGVLAIFRGAVVGGLFRLYGGGGGWVGVRLFKDDKTPCGRVDTDGDGQGDGCNMGKTASFSGGGFTGIEFFQGSRSYFLEVGAQGAAHPSRMDGGLYLHAGSNWAF